MENVVRETAYTMVPASSDETRYLKAKSAAEIAAVAHSISVIKLTQMLYLLIIVGNGTIVQKMPRN